MKTASFAADIVRIHGARQVQVGIGVEASSEFIALMVQVAFNIKTALEIGPVAKAAGWLAVEARTHVFIGLECEHAQHAGNCDTVCRWIIIIIIAAQPAWIEHDRAALDFVEGNSLTMKSC